MIRWEMRPSVLAFGYTPNRFLLQDGKDFLISLVFLSQFQKIPRGSPDVKHIQQCQIQTALMT